MLMEVYYEHYAENCKEQYWEMEKKSLPYMVLFPSVEAMWQFMQTLEGDGLRCVSANRDYKGLLVNLELMRYGVIHRACKHACVDDRNFAPEEFRSEIYDGWRASSVPADRAI